MTEIVEQIDATNGRWYRLDNGLVIPSVTTVVDVYPKPELMDWYGLQPSLQEANRVRDEAAAWGTLIHEACYDLINGEVVDVSEWEDAKAIKKLLGFKRWYEETQPHITSIELAVTDGHAIAGQLDLVADIGGVTWVLDLKTSGDVYPSHHIQVAAYREAYNQQHGGADACGILHLKSTTKKGWQLVEVQVEGPQFGWVSPMIAYDACYTLFTHLHGSEPKQSSKASLPTSVQLEV